MHANIKFVEPWRNRIGIRLGNNEKYYLKWTSKTSFVTHKIFNNNLAIIHKIKTNLTLNKIAYVRIWMLELNKVPMYQLHYDYIKNKYGNK